MSALLRPLRGLWRSFAYGGRGWSGIKRPLMRRSDDIMSYNGTASSSAMSESQWTNAKIALVMSHSMRSPSCHFLAACIGPLLEPQSHESCSQQPKPILHGFGLLFLPRRNIKHKTLPEKQVRAPGEQDMWERCIVGVQTSPSAIGTRMAITSPLAIHNHSSRI